MIANIPTYTGFDVVPSVISSIALRRPGHTWICADVLHDPDLITSAEVLLIKDVLHHWPTSSIVSFLNWVVENRNRWKDVLICVDRHQVEDGADCPLGAYRALSHTMRPLSQFNLTLEMEFLHKAIYSLGS